MVIAGSTGNDFTHETVKHVTVKVRFLQECVQRKIILIVYIRTNKYIADIMAKRSPGPQCVALCAASRLFTAIDVITSVIAAVAETQRKTCIRV